MSKPSKNTSEQEGEISVSMVRFTMKGSDASLQKGLDAIKAALFQAGFGIVQEAKPQLRGSSAPRLAAANGEEAEPELVGDVPHESEVEDATLAAAPAPKKQGAPKKPKNFKIMRELKFDDSIPTLEAFINEKKPSSHLERYLCIAYWFKHTVGVEDLTTEHFFTAYMHYDWSLPGNAATPIADLRHQKRQLFIAGATLGTCTINNAGERRVREMGKVDA
ncbi:hypothetical protein KPB04_13560 [Burkholderia cenocepacia]|uniref:hypothetical protein n=1 Tax=Burkholderia cenocepacia TaxID=95486 RepID=UPI00285BA8D0|nr:hypothetical protein [Burkholderia cenocepacia]MDR8102758.1 hypothetical protein [Burkholderia cenocepacia]